MPAIITGSASGNSTDSSDWRGVMPTPCAASRIRGVDAVQAGDGVAQHRQHRIERERQHGGQESERREADAEPRQRQRRQRQQQRIKQRQQRQPRHRLHDAGEPEQHAARYSTIAYRNRQRQADRKAQRQRRDADPHMIAEIIRQMAPAPRSSADRTTSSCRAIPRQQYFKPLGLPPRRAQQFGDVGIAAVGKLRWRALRQQPSGARITAIRSASRMASVMSWVIMMVVSPSFLCSAR